MNRARLYQLEQRDFGLEAGSVSTLHLEGSRHRAKWRRKRAARGVFKALAGLECGLFADHARAMNFFGMSRPVDDRPVAVDQLDGCFPLVRDTNGVQEKPPTRGGIAVFGGELCANLDADALGFGFGLRFKKIFVRHGADVSSQRGRQRRRGVRRS